MIIPVQALIAMSIRNFRALTGPDANGRFPIHNPATAINLES